MPLECIVDARSMLANLFEESNWGGRLPCFCNWNNPFTVTKNLLEFLVVVGQYFDFLVLAFGEAELDTFQMPFPWSLLF